MQKIVDYAALGEDGKLSVSTAEHFLPLLYIIGTKHEDEKISIPVDGGDLGAISMLSAVVGAL